MSAFNQDSGAKLLEALKRGIENITLNVLNENPRDYHKRGRVISQDEWGWILSIDNATYTRVPSLERVADYKQGDVVEVMIPNGQPSNMFIMGRIGGVVSSGGGDIVTKEYLNGVLRNYVTNTNLTLALVNYVTTANLNDILSGYVTDAKLATQLANYVTTTALNNALVGYAKTADLATVATTGSYSDLRNIPTDIAKISNLANPNLLINPDFSINQRRITAIASGANKYSVDRWKTGANNSFVNVLDKGIEVGISGVTTAGPRNAIQQTIEDFEKYKGLPLTLSMKYSDLVEEVPNTTRLIMLGGAAGNKYTILSSVGSSGIVSVKNWTFPTGAPTLVIAVNGLQAAMNYSLKIEWIKLEVGSVATEFIPPLIAEELPKCQRYYIKMNSSKKDTPNFIGMLNQNKDNLSAQIAVPQELRTMPTIIGSGTLRMWNGSTASNISYSIAGKGLQNKMGNNMGVTFIVTDDGTLTSGQIYLCNFQTGGSNIAFDAEIY